MIEADLIQMAPLANDTTQVFLQAGPPSDLPAQVPDFVGDILDTIRSATGEGGIGDTISELTPGGNETADGAGSGAAGGDGNSS